VASARLAIGGASTMLSRKVVIASVRLPAASSWRNKCECPVGDYALITDTKYRRSTSWLLLQGTRMVAADP